MPSSSPDSDRNAWTKPGVEELGGGLYRIPLPLPGDALKAVNVYAIASGDGVYLVDSGMALAGAKEQLTGALATIGYGLGDIRNFFITHIHRDHYTLAMELKTTLRGEIAIGEGEKENLRLILAAAAGKGERGLLLRMHQGGADELIKALRDAAGASREGHPDRQDRQGRQGRQDHQNRGDRQDQSHQPDVGLPWTEPDRWLPDGTVLDLKSRTLRTIATPGHTEGHVVYHDETNAALFAGDHVLPHITPSIGFQPVVTRTALRDYLESLKLMLTLPDALLLPAHGPVSTSTHARVNELLEHHEDRLAQTLEVVGPGTTAYEAAKAIPWTRRQSKFADLDLMNQMLATGETGAHLEVLALRGQLTRHTTEEGIDTYSRGA
jgi:glyoxylase-like metal-dependent hydrolase (beta-lactamase superfamily II)